MHGTNSGNDISDNLVCAVNFNPLLFDFFELPHFANSRMRFHTRQKSPDAADAKTAKRIIPDFSCTRLAYRLSNLICVCNRHCNDNLFHLLL